MRQAGTLLSIEVFEGNTQDPKTFANQIKKVADRFGSGEVTLVGDRGMIKNRQIEDMHEYGFNYITAITKPQIRSLIQQGIFQLGLFDQKLSEVIGDDGVSRIIKELSSRWQALNVTVEEGIRELTMLCMTEVRVNGVVQYNQTPQPRELKGGSGEINRLINEKYSNLKEVISGATHTGKETIEKTRQTWEEAVTKGEEKTKEIGTEIDRRVRTNPWLAVGIAAVSGFLFCYIIETGKRSK
ncbi:MAG: transposase [Candidatus Brocadiaceae bacterium]|nr:transposase [Candidatus Brocadiaceae bacterium]